MSALRTALRPVPIVGLLCTASWVSMEWLTTASFFCCWLRRHSLLELRWWDNLFGRRRKKGATKCTWGLKEVRDVPNHQWLVARSQLEARPWGPPLGLLCTASWVSMEWLTTASFFCCWLRRHSLLELRWWDNLFGRRRKKGATKCTWGLKEVRDIYIHWWTYPLGNWHIHTLERGRSLTQKRRRGRGLLVPKRVYIPFKSKTGKRINHLPKS